MQEEKKIYVALEGVNGSGKSTIMSHIKPLLPQMHFIKEPQSYIHNQKKLYHNAVSNQLAIMAARYAFFQEECHSCAHIISDRSFISNMCYFPAQPAHIRQKFMDLCHGLMAQILEPCDSLVIILDASFEVVTGRITHVAPEWVFQHYQEIENIFGKTVHINAERDPSIVAQDVIAVLQAHHIIQR